MPILDPAARLRSLQHDLGPTRDPDAPSSFTVELWVGDPTFAESYEMPATTTLDDASVVANGYAAPTILSDDFAPVDYTMTQRVQWPDATAEWPDEATHWLLRDTATGQAWDYAVLDQELFVSAAGPGPAIDVTVFYDDDITIEESA